MKIKILLTSLFLSFCLLLSAQNKLFELDSPTVFEESKAVLALPNDEYLVAVNFDDNKSKFVRINKLGEKLGESAAIPNVLLSGIVSNDASSCYVFGESLTDKKTYLAKVALPSFALTPIPLTAALPNVKTTLYAGAKTASGFVFVGKQTDTDKNSFLYLLKVIATTPTEIVPDSTMFATFGNLLNPYATTVVEVAGKTFIAGAYQSDTKAFLWQLGATNIKTFPLGNATCLAAQDSSFILGTASGAVKLFDKNAKETQSTNLGFEINAACANDGKYYLTGVRNQNMITSVLKSDLTILNTEQVPVNQSIGYAVATNTNTYIAIGSYETSSDIQVLGSINDLQKAKPVSYTLQGYVKATTDCNKVANTKLDKWLIEATLHGKTYNAVTNNGLYTLILDTVGIVELKTLAVEGWASCNASIVKDTVLASGIQDFAADIVLRDTTNKLPFLHIDLAANYINPAGQNTIYYGVVTNNTSDSVKNARVYAHFSSEMAAVSANVPTIATASPDSIILNLGTVLPNSKKYFTVTRKLTNPPADPQRAYFAEAEVRPYLTKWKGPRLRISAICTGAKAIFSITNTGNDSIPTPVLEKGAIIIVDELVFKVIAPQVQPGETKTIEFDALNKSTFTFVMSQGTEQNPNPYSNYVGRKLQACGTNGSYNSELIYIDGDDDKSYSYDSDTVSTQIPQATIKATPAGKIGVGQIAEVLDSLTTFEYKVIYKGKKNEATNYIELLVELSKPYNLSQIEFGVCKHRAYQVTMLGENKMLFVLSNLNLPAANTNDADATGFLTFRVKIPLRDNKDSIFTNTVGQRYNVTGDFETIGTKSHVVRRYGGFTYSGLVATLELSPLNTMHSISIAPNPFDNQTLITLPQALLNDAPTTIFQVFDLSGKMLHQQTVTSETFLFEAQHLPPGFYLAQLQQQGRVVARGKMMK